MISRASITAQSFILGEVRADPAQLRGEGGPVNPTVVLQLSVTLNPRPAEGAIVVTQLWGRLHMDGAGGGTPIGELVRGRATSEPQALWASRPTASAEHSVYLRVPLTPTQLRAVEDTPPIDGQVLLRLELTAEAAWLRKEHTHVLGSTGGSAMELLPLAWVRIDDLRLAVPVAYWAERVLPAVGADRYRTLLIVLPTESPLTPGQSLVRWFDEARGRYDRGDYRGCIERCRDVRRAVEVALGATRDHPVSARTGPVGVPAGTTAFVDGVWAALAQVTNEAHHSEYAEPASSAADARAVLLTTAVMLDYLGRVLAPPPLP